MSTPLNEALGPSQATKSSDRSGAPDTCLQGRRLILARVGWGAAVTLIVVPFLAKLLATYTFLQTICTGATCGLGQPTLDSAQAMQKLGLSVPTYAAFTLALTLALAVLCFVVSAVIFWRRSDDWMALLVALSVVATFTLNGNDVYGSHSAWGVLTTVLAVLGSGVYVLVLALFPDGRFVPGWTRWLLLCWALSGMVVIFFPDASFGWPVYNLVWRAELVLLMIAQVYRSRTASSPLQRQQSKWLLYGGSVAVIFIVGLTVPTLLFPSLGQAGSFYRLVITPAYVVISFTLPLCIGIAILRYRLYDIDVLINRTLVYGTLTVSVVGLYVLVVGYLGALFQSSDNVLISLVATGLVAVLFHPLRAGLQRGVNRLLYGQRDEPYTVITRLSQRLEGTLAPEAVLSTIVETVAQALKLPYVAILLRQQERFALAASCGRVVAEPLILPLVYQTETIGQLHLAPRTPGEALTPADRRLLDELVRQAGLVAHAIELTSALQRSHEQLEQRVQERTRQLSSLLEISHMVASTLHLKPLLGLILEQLKTVIDYTGAAILAVKGEELLILDSRSPTPEDQRMQLRFPLKQLGRIWETMTFHESILIPDVREETPLAQAFQAAMGELRETSWQHVRACLIVPLTLKEQVIGMLVLTSSQERAFTEQHAALVLTIANQAAIAMENAQLYEQAQELAAVEERQRLARELHDSVSQALYGIALGLHTARIQLERDPQELPESLDYLLSLAEAALDEMRALIFELRPESLETEGLVAALTKQAAALQARHEIVVSTELCEEPDLPLRTKQDLYRIAQEALHNTVKHARASQVVLRLYQTADGMTMQVRDDGVGFDPTASFPGHLGLHSMRERVANLGGTLQVESTPGAGTGIWVRIPGRA